MALKLLFVDVGTHEAQEYQALFEHGRLGYFRRWLRHRRHARRAGRELPSFAAFQSFLRVARYLKANRASVFYVMVEPNARLFVKPVYQRADVAFNLALAAEPETAAVRPLFLANSDPLGQGSSLFTEKPNVIAAEYDLVLSLDALHFARQLHRTVADLHTSDPVPVVLRLNNEGAEVEVIEAFHAVFGDRLQLVMGSLNDVIKVKGQAAYDRLMTFLDQQGIAFVPLHSDYATWPNAADRVRGLLR